MKQGNLVLKVLGWTIVATVVFVLIGKIGRKRAHKYSIEQEFHRHVSARDRLLNPKEFQMYRIIKEAFPNQLVFCQVALSQLIDIKPGAPKGLANRFYRLVADFVVCDTDTKPWLVIEVDGRSHRTTVQAERDTRKDIVVTEAGLKILRISAAHLPIARELRRMAASR